MNSLVQRSKILDQNVALIGKPMIVSQEKNQVSRLLDLDGPHSLRSKGDATVLSFFICAASAFSSCEGQGESQGQGKEQGFWQSQQGDRCIGIYIYVTFDGVQLCANLHTCTFDLWGSRDQS